MVNPSDPRDSKRDSASSSFSHWVTGGTRPYIARCLSCGLRQPLTMKEYMNRGTDPGGVSICPHCGDRDLRVSPKETNSNLLLFAVIVLLALASRIC